MLPFSLSTADYDDAGIELCKRKMSKYMVTGVLPSDGYTCRQTVPIIGKKMVKLS